MKNSSIILAQLEKLIGVQYDKLEVQENFHGYSEINDISELTFNHENNIVSVFPHDNFDTVFYIELEENQIIGVWAE